jgi:hypothetical protein
VIPRLEHEPELYLQLLRTPYKVEDLFRLLRQTFELSCQARERLV